MFWTGAGVVGLVSVPFVKLADVAQSDFHTISGNGRRLARPAAVSYHAVGLILCAWAAHIYFPEPFYRALSRIFVAKAIRGTGRNDDVAGPLEQSSRDGLLAESDR